MFLVSLNEVMYTIASGLLSLAGIFMPICLFSQTFSKWLLARFYSDLMKAENRVLSFTLIVVVVILSFIAGMLAEHISDSLTENLQLRELDFLSESRLRAEILFNDDGTLRSQGRELYDVGALQEFGLNYTTDTGSVVNSLYYRAKNTVYQHRNYFLELSRIQTHIDFARSLAVISLFLSCFGIVTIFMFLGVNKVKSGEVGWARVGTPAVFVCVYISMFISGGVSFLSDETEFNKRVFGYYSTILANAKSSPQPKDSKELRVPLSGIIRWGDDYIVVSDEKGNSLPRLYNLEFRKRSNHPPRIYPVSVDWRDLNSTKPTDIESICTTGNVDKGDGDIWVLESGYYEDEEVGVYKPGRLVQLKPSTGPHQLAYAGHAEFESLSATKYKDIEGMHCWRIGDNLPVFVVAERGDSDPATLHVWGIKEKEKKKKQRGKKWTVEKRQSCTVPELEYLSNESSGADVRWISGLTGEPQGQNANIKQTLWATGGVEIEVGDKLKLASVVYRVAEIRSEGSSICVVKEPKQCLEFPKDKFEGIAMTGNPGEFAIVADNEKHGLARVVRGCPDSR